MTPDLEELIRLYAAVMDAPAGDQHRVMNLFRIKCREIAARHGVKVSDVETYAARACYRMRNASERR
ncbi:MAG: hypothetical protein LBM04_01910, partial [Opitutaceae bacterium]|nr:hypothetical protein [Opitutaceae bacterium]